MTTVNKAESTKECVEQIANFALRWQECDRKAVKAWGEGDEATGDKWAALGSKMLDAEVAYTLALKERMIEEGRFFVETLTHTAHMEPSASMTNGITPVVTRKEA